MYCQRKRECSCARQRRGALGEHEQARELSMDTLTRCQRLLADGVAGGAIMQEGHLRIRQLEQWIRSRYQPVKG